MIPLERRIKDILDSSSRSHFTQHTASFPALPENMFASPRRKSRRQTWSRERGKGKGAGSKG